MAEPIRKTALPLHRRPPGVRPHPRPRPVPWGVDEMEPSPLAHLRMRTPAPEPPRPVPSPAVTLPEESEPEPLESARPRTRTFQPVREKKLRAVLQTALGLHLAALLLPFLASSAGRPSPALSDTLLASVVLLAGGAVLAFGAFRRR
jgi:hypothetical protein